MAPEKLGAERVPVQLRAFVRASAFLSQSVLDPPERVYGSRVAKNARGEAHGEGFGHRPHSRYLRTAESDP